MNVHIYANTELQEPDARSLNFKITTKLAKVCIVGLGYVGLPLGVTCAVNGFRVTGLDTNQARVDAINAGNSGIPAVENEVLSDLVQKGTFAASASEDVYGESDVICICVPTPLSRQREPDLSFVESAVRGIARHLRRGQLIILESTTYPGTTDDVVKPILEATGLVSGRDFFIGYSPEREDPGNAHFNTATIPKVISGDGLSARHLVEAFYGSFIEKVVPTTSVRTAEVVKITENVFRSVNIALINELKVIYSAMGIDIWEVIDAARTKPFGFMPFYPGPGLGGHCIPVDPFYLTWKSREFELPTRFIELAGEINQSMPKYVISKLEDALDIHFGLALSQSNVLVVGVSYKKNVSDVRESPALKILECLHKRTGSLSYHDPHVPELMLPTANGTETLRSIELGTERVAGFDVVLILADHDAVDYQALAVHSRMVVDTRNAIRSRGHKAKRLVLA